jgi:hypothetical protein
LAKLPESGHFCRIPTIFAGIRQKKAGSRPVDRKPAVLAGFRPAGQDPAVMGGSRPEIRLERPDRSRIPARWPMIRLFGKIWAGIRRCLSDFAGFRPYLSNSGTDWSGNLACQNPTIFNCLNVKVDCVESLHLPSMENDLRFKKRKSFSEIY